MVVADQINIEYFSFEGNETVQDKDKRGWLRCL